MIGKILYLILLLFKIRKSISISFLCFDTPNKSDKNLYATVDYKKVNDTVSSLEFVKILRKPATVLFNVSKSLEGNDGSSVSAISFENETVKKVVNAKTGDGATPVIWGLTSLLSLLVIAMLVMLKRRKFF